MIGTNLFRRNWLAAGQFGMALLVMLAIMGCEKDPDEFSEMEEEVETSFSQLVAARDGSQETEVADNNNMFNFYFNEDFEANSLGIYKDAEWQIDWNYPAWSSRQVSPEIMQDLNLPFTGSQFMRWHFPAGSVGPDQGGGQWFTKFGNLNEVYLSYNVRFKPGFDFVISGKIPGLRGGPRWEGAGPPSFTDGFVALLCWNKDGYIKFYYYHHNQEHEYGDMVTWNHLIERGEWFNVTVRIVINTLNATGGNSDGIMEGFIDGKMVAQVTGLKLREVSNISIDQIFMTSSFGGTGSQFAATNNEWIDVDNVVIYTLPENSSAVKGNKPNAQGTQLALPSDNLIMR